MGTRALGRTTGALVLAGALLTGCLSDGSCADVLGVQPAAASCAAGVDYDGDLYVAWSDRLPVARGRALGPASYPPCDDSGCTEGEVAPGTPTRVWAMRGVDPSVLVVGRLQGTDRWVVFARPDADPRDHFRRVEGRWELRSRHR